MKSQDTHSAPEGVFIHNMALALDLALEAKRIADMPHGPKKTKALLALVARMEQPDVIAAIEVVYPPEDRS